MCQPSCSVACMCAAVVCVRTRISFTGIIYRWRSNIHRRYMPMDVYNCAVYEATVACYLSDAVDIRPVCVSCIVRNGMGALLPCGVSVWDFYRSARYCWLVAVLVLRTSYFPNTCIPSRNPVKMCGRFIHLCNLTGKTSLRFQSVAFFGIAYRQTRFSASNLFDQLLSISFPHCPLSSRALHSINIWANNAAYALPMR